MSRGRVSQRRSCWIRSGRDLIDAISAFIDGWSERSQPLSLDQDAETIAKRRK